MNDLSTANAEKKDNPTHNRIITEEINNLKEALKFNAGQFTYKGGNSKYSSTTLTHGQLEADEKLNDILRDEILAPLLTSPDFKRGWGWYSYYLYNSILNATIYQLDFVADIIFNYDIMHNVISNYAVRVHAFNDGWLNYQLRYSIVDVITGNEEYRITTNTSIGETYYDYDAQMLRNVRKVVNGVVDEITPLSFSDELKVISCIPIGIIEYQPALDYLWAVHTDSNGKQQKSVNPNRIKDATTAYQGKSNGFPFRDGVNGQLLLKAPRLLAINKDTTIKGSYIFGWSFLPWNESQYYLFDTEFNTYRGINPINSSNFMTIIKLLLLGILAGEIIALFRRGKLSFNLIF